MRAPTEPLKTAGILGEAPLGALCRVGGVAAWLLVVYCLTTLVLLFVLGGQPATAGEAYDLLQRSRLVGLLRLDLPTVLALPLYYLVFLGLFVPSTPARTRLTSAAGRR